MTLTKEQIETMTTRPWLVLKNDNWQLSVTNDHVSIGYTTINDGMTESYCVDTFKFIEITDDTEKHINNVISKNGILYL